MNKRKAKETADAIEALHIAVLNALDCELSPWQRAKAEEIYDLSSDLETGESENETE